MPLKLKEDPREWKKFITAAVLLLSLLSTLLWRRHSIPDQALQGIFACLASLLALALVRPRIFRPIYRAGMHFSHAAGQILGRILLVFCFLFVLTPLAMLLRILGRDLLPLRPDSNVTSYWVPARSASRHDRAF